MQVSADCEEPGKRPEKHGQPPPNPARYPQINTYNSAVNTLEDSTHMSLFHRESAERYQDSDMVYHHLTFVDLDRPFTSIGRRQMMIVNSVEILWLGLCGS